MGCFSTFWLVRSSSRAVGIRNPAVLLGVAAVVFPLHYAVVLVDRIVEEDSPSLEEMKPPPLVRRRGPAVGLARECYRPP